MSRPNPMPHRLREPAIKTLRETAEAFDKSGAHSIAAAYRELAAFRDLANRANNETGADAVRALVDFIELGVAETEALEDP